MTHILLFYLRTSSTTKNKNIIYYLVYFFYSTSLWAFIIQPVTWRDWPITAVIQLFFVLVGRIRDMGR